MNMEIETKEKENDMPNYLSNKRPDFKPFIAKLGEIPAYQFKGDLASELKAKRLTKALPEVAIRPGFRGQAPVPQPLG